MTRKLMAYQHLFEMPICSGSRVLLVLSMVAILGVFTAPLWKMSFRSNQYPDPLRMTIHINGIEGQKTEDRDDLREINSLNHYIGMRPLLESDFSEFQWMPFVIGGLILIGLRALVFGTVRDLVDITVVFTYFGLYSTWDFAHRLYAYGHNLAPDAAIKVEGFTPPFFGAVKIANFWVESFPAFGSIALAAGGALLVAALAVALRAAWVEQHVGAAPPSRDGE